jgi:FkbM family methyltransferase
MSLAIIAQNIKKIIRKFLSLRPVSEFIRLVVTPFKGIVPESIISRIPLVGNVSISLPNSKRLVLKSDGDDLVASRMFWRGVSGFEGDSMIVFISLLRYVKVFFDVGAHAGIYSLIAAIDDPGRTVFAFEPVPRIIKRLTENKKINGILNLVVSPTAVTDSSGTAKLYVPDQKMPYSASIREGFRSNTEQTLVSAVTLDLFSKMNDISRVDLIKIDTESTEHSVLKGAKEILSRDKPLIICEILPGFDEKKINSFLGSFGYRFFWLAGGKLRERGCIEGDYTYKHANYLFVPKEKMEMVFGNADLKKRVEFLEVGSS